MYVLYLSYYDIIFNNNFIYLFVAMTFFLLLLVLTILVKALLFRAILIFSNIVFLGEECVLQYILDYAKIS